MLKNPKKKYYPNNNNNIHNKPENPFFSKSSWTHTSVSDRATYSTYTWEWSAVYLSQHRSTGLCLSSCVCAFWWMFLRATVMVCLGIHCTFEVGSDAGIISWCLPHELVQEVGRRQLWPCPAGGLYLLLTGAQSDIRRESGNKYKEKEKRRFGSSGGGKEKNNENPTEWEANSYHQVSHQQKNTRR